jgi:nucleoside-diphosphate-sugar epimerase
MTSGIERVFVTGVAGLIGSNTARAFVEDGATVVGIDNFWRGSRENIVELLARRNFSFRHADLISDQDWCSDLGPNDVLIHVADIVAGIGYVFSHEWTVFQKNLLINTSVARVVVSRLPRHLIYLGTACSYPRELQRSVESSMLSEGHKFPADPESGYGWSKLIGEIEFRLATKQSNTRLTVLDLHNVYGWPCAYQDATAQVMPSLIYRAINARDHKLTVWGNGQQGRAFVHVADVVAAIRLAFSYSGSSSTFMIGPRYCTTIGELAHIIQDHPRISIDEIVFDLSKPTGDIGRFADATLAQSELGWTPKVDLRAGVHDLVDRIMDDVR